MRIAFISYFNEEISPDTRSGIEAFSYNIIPALAKLPEITAIDVYGVGKDYLSGDKVRFISLLPSTLHDYTERTPLLKESISQDFAKSKLQYGIAIKAFKIILEQRYDLIHNNSTIPIFESLIDILGCPVLTTIHTVMKTASIAIPFSLDLIGGNKQENYYVTVSDYQIEYARKNHILLNILRSIHNGITMENSTFRDNTSSAGYGLWLGRIHKADNKGLKEAIFASDRAAKKLKIIGKIDDADFFKKEIINILGDKQFIGSTLPITQKLELLCNASYFLYPLQWEEPFGLVFLEAMACGTPIIAFARGAVPEIIKDGVTGFIVNPSDADIRGNWIIKKTGIEGLVEAMQKISSLSEEEYKQMRRNCLKHVEENFSANKMAYEYLQTYKQILATHASKQVDNKVDAEITFSLGQ